MNLIYVHVGDNFPEYYYDSLKQSQKYFSGTIHSITGKEANDLLSRNENNKEFEKVNFLNKYGMNNFWSVTFQRMFVIEQFMKENNLEDVIHIENDVLIYENPEKYLKQLHRFYKDFNLIGINSLTEHHSTFAYVYIPNYLTIEKLNQEMIKLLSLGEQKLIDLSCETMINEMVLLRLIYKMNTDIVEYLPTLAYNEDLLNFNFGVIYDSASIGQFVGGTPFHQPGFIDDRHFVGQYIKEKNIKIIWENKEPFVLDGENKYKLANLHIHSKNLKAFV